MTLYDFDKYVSPLIYSRGEAYWNEGRVDLVANVGETYYFDVQGSDVYLVDIELDGKGQVVSHNCDCPYDRGLCKHEVACLLYLRDLKQSESTKGDIWESLSAEELSYLYYLALTGESVPIYSNTGSRLSLPSDSGTWKPTTVQRKSIVQRFARLGLVKEYYERDSAFNGYRVFRVPYIRALEALVHLYRNHSDWASRFVITKGRMVPNVIISAIAKYLAGGEVDFSTLSSGLFDGLSEDFIKAVEVAIEQDESGKLPSLLPLGIMSALVCDETARLKYKGDFVAMQRAYDNTTAIAEPGVGFAEAHAELRMCWFYTTGQLLEAMPGESSFPAYHFLNAALHLAEGRVDDSILEFRLAMAQQPVMKWGVRDVPLDPWNQYLYICALGMRGSKADHAELEKIQVALRRREQNAYSCFSFFVDVILGRQLKENMLLECCGNALERSFSDIISVFAFGSDHLMKSRRNQSLAEIATDTFGLDLLNNEFVALVGEQARDPYSEKPWTYEALITRVRKRELWESALTGLIKLVAPSKAGTGEQKERLIYFCRYSDTLEVKLQGKLKSGGYSRGKALSASRYASCECPMDETDKAIHRNWERNGRGPFPTLGEVLPYCVGTDKLFVDNRNGFMPAKVIEEKPYLATVRQDGRISFHSNVPAKVLSAYNDKLIYEWSSNHDSVTFWRIGQAESQVLRILLGLKSVPLEAEPMLENLFAPLRGRLEVQSDVKGGVQLERKEGSTLLCARLRRERDSYSVTFLSHPLEGGSVYLEPGKGSVVILDGDGESRFEMVRDLKKENRVLKKAMAFLDCQFSVDEYLPVDSLLYALENPSEFKDIFYFEWPEGQELRLKTPTSSDFHITANGKGGWFELEGDLKLSEDVVLSVAELLQMTRGGGRYVKLGENEFLSLSEQLRSQLGRLESVAQKSRNKLVIPQLAMSMISDSVDDVVEVPDESLLAERRNLIREASKMEFSVPEGLNAVLRPYQEEGFRWMMRLAHWNAGACLADDMGLGKTLQAIAFMLANASKGAQMVVAPASVVGNWESEIRRFAPSLKVVIVNSIAASERNGAIVSSGAGTIVLTSYGVLASDINDFASLEWVSVVLDEAHTIKNRETRMSAAVMSLKASNRLILTGTPIQNHLGELWNLFRFINPDLLGSFEHFQENYVVRDTPQSRDTLKRLVSPFMLRRTKSEVARELPEKTEITINVDLEDGEKAVYEVLRREAVRELEFGGPLSVNALAMMTKLRMASCSASLVESSWDGACSKLDAFQQKLQDIVEGGNNVLVFSQFTSFLSMAKSRAEALGIKDCLYLDGSTPLAKRRKMVDEFQAGKVSVFFISLKAGGLGLNLTGANYVIHLDPWWNPAIEQQATDRAYRIGQQKNVTVYHLISTGTIEEKILRLHGSKQQLADAILSGASASHKLSAEEILNLIQEV